MVPRLALTVVLLVGLVIAAPAQGPDAVDSALRFLEVRRHALPVSLFDGLSAKATARSVRVTARFDHELSDAEIAALEAGGLRFDRREGRVVHVGRIYVGELAWDALDALAARDDVERLESVWRPKVCRPLDLSVPEIRVDQVWGRTDGGGLPLTGKGVVIADFDSGVDVYHPDFWRADGGEFDWIDANANNTFDSGTDGVDLNGNSILDASERLRFFDGVLTDAYGTRHNQDGVFQTDLDWLYNDANNNGARDYNAGFSEADPTFGERLFLARDANGNRALDPGEKLAALGTSKIKAVRDASGNVYARGTNLKAAPGDPGTHGTSVSAVLVGQERGLRRYVGMAPDADLVVADLANLSQGDFVNYMSWARDQGARVMIHEIGIFTFEFMDGSGNYEQAVDTYAAQGIVQVVPAGNLAGGGKHALASAGGNSTLSQPIAVDAALNPRPRYLILSVLWRSTTNDLAFTLRHPGGATLALSGSAGTGWDSTNFQGHSVWSARSKSSRGTQRFDIYIVGGSDQAPVPLAVGTWGLDAANAQPAAEQVHFFSADEVSTWGGGIVFAANRSDEGTIDVPSTADRAISVASYSTRGLVVSPGALSTFSARGRRIDGTSIMDVAAPGNYDIYCAIAKDIESGSLGQYWAFGGTSAAGPHVTGVCALLVQAKPAATHDEIKAVLRQTARTDLATGTVPNDSWGMGKIDALAALEALGVGPERDAGDANHDGVVDTRDAIRILRHVGGQEPLAGDDQPYADVDGAQGITVGDADWVLDRTVGN